MNLKLNESKKYDPATRKKVRRAIKSLYKDGFDYTEIAETLAKEGIQTPQGTVPDETFVRNQMHYINKSRARTKRAVPVHMAAESKPVKAKLSTDLLTEDILTHPDLSDSQKVQMLSAYHSIAQRGRK